MIIEGYQIRKEKKKDIVYCRMTESMIQELKMIKEKTGVHVSEIMREAIRRLIKDVEAKGSLNIDLLT